MARPDHSSPTQLDRDLAELKLLEIAQQTLGDRGRWSEIYRLNPNLRPELPVPGGTA